MCSADNNSLTNSENFRMQTTSSQCFRFLLSELPVLRLNNHMMRQCSGLTRRQRRQSCLHAFEFYSFYNPKPDLCSEFPDRKRGSPCRRGLTRGRRRSLAPARVAARAVSLRRTVGPPLSPHRGPRAAARPAVAGRRRLRAHSRATPWTMAARCGTRGACRWRGCATARCSSPA